MKFKVTEDKNFLLLEDSTSLEFEQIESSLTKLVNNWFIIKKKMPYWDGKIKFFDKYNRVPLGLWGEVKNIAKEYNFPLKIDGINEIFNKNYDEKDFYNWVKEYFKDADDLKPRDYQVEAAKNILFFKRCTEEISTSGGKTLIVFIVFKYLLDKGIINKMLYVVPNLSLITQTEEKFYEYEEKCGKKPTWKSLCVHGESKKKFDYEPNIIFGTYQSLTKKKIDFFKDFDSIAIDETHHAVAKSIKNILVKSYNAEYKFGVTGTLPKKGSCESFTVQAYLGPKVFNLQSYELINRGKATPLKVINIELNYLDDETKEKLYKLRNVPGDQKDGVKLLNLEKETARSNNKRFSYIVNTISRVNKNSLVLFSDIKNEYGRDIYKWLRENTDKNIYYIDGKTEGENRDYYKAKMDEEDNVILVASIGTFSEGIDINNIHNLFIVESSKSEKIVRQMLGRGMRLSLQKPFLYVFDFSDNFIWGTDRYQKFNYLMRHAYEREKIYKENKFPFKKFKVSL